MSGLSTRSFSIRPAAVAAAVLLGSLGASPVVGQAPASSAVRVSTGAMSLNVGGRLHTQFNTTSVDGEPSSELFIRRARIELSVDLGNRVSGALQPEFGNDQVGLRDAYIDFAVTPDVTLRTGKAYRPFGLLEQTSSKRILPVERGLRIRGLNAWDGYGAANALGYSDRDVGVQVLAELAAGLDLTAGVFRGPLHGDVDPEASYQYAARLTHQASEAVRFGAGWSSRDFERPGGPAVDLERGHAFEVDVEYGSFAPGLHILAEWVMGDADPVADVGFRGGQAWIAYRTAPLNDAGNMVEPLVRVSYSDIDTDGIAVTRTGGTLLTPGVAFYLSPQNRIAVNYDFWFGQNGAPDAQGLKVMFQLGF